MCICMLIKLYIYVYLSKRCARGFHVCSLSVYSANSVHVVHLQVCILCTEVQVFSARMTVAYMVYLKDVVTALAFSNVRGIQSIQQ